MTGLVRKAAVIAALFLLAASTALAGVPSPANSTIPNCVMLLPGVDDGYSNFLIASYQPWTVNIKDVANNNLDGVSVIVDVQNADDVKVADAQEADAIVDCITNTVRKSTGGVYGPGNATFRVRGAGKNSLLLGGIGPGSMSSTRVFAGATLMENIRATAPDENGAGDAGTVVNGLNASDLAFFLYDLFNYAPTAGRSDFNCSNPGAVDPLDLAAFLLILFNDATSAAPQVTTYCPN